MITARGLHKSYGSLEVLRGVDVDIGKGEFVCITGKSGAGKTTLLHILGTLDRADAGKLSIEGKNINDLKGKALAAFRNLEIGFVFQFHHLLPEFTALENVMIPAFIAGKSKKEIVQRATGLLEYLGLSERLDHKPSELSGGEQQRVAVA
ncbi:MAG TPA: ABC transporter ATP-binding protein, partial [Phaeodactylibacter sp.]|nr:ABC transporter ATP-binding protein [Phaeodactylibacter sp.]